MLNKCWIAGSPGGGLGLISKNEYCYDGSYAAWFNPSFLGKSHYAAAGLHAFVVFFLLPHRMNPWPFVAQTLISEHFNL